MGIGSHSDSSCTDSSAISISAAVTLSPADSLCIAFSQCRSTVEGLIPSLRAICLDCMWPATSRRHSRSRTVRRSRTPFTVSSERSSGPGRSRRSPCPAPARTRSAACPLVPCSPTVPCLAHTPARTHVNQREPGLSVNELHRAIRPEVVIRGPTDGMFRRRAPGAADGAGVVALAPKSGRVPTRRLGRGRMDEAAFVPRRQGQAGRLE